MYLNQCKSKYTKLTQIYLRLLNQSKCVSSVTVFSYFISPRANCLFICINTFIIAVGSMYVDANLLLSIWQTWRRKLNYRYVHLFMVRFFLFTNSLLLSQLTDTCEPPPIAGNGERVEWVRQADRDKSTATISKFRSASYVAKMLKRCLVHSRQRQ